jgi:error-prone DNA polymerase
MPELPEPKIKPHPWKRDKGPVAVSPQSLRPAVPQSLPQYAELQVTSNFSFLRGAGHPEELVEQAAGLGHQAVAVTDVNTMAGVVRAHLAAREVGIPLVVGCRLVLGWESHEVTKSRSHEGEAPRLSVLTYPTDRAAYGRLCRLLTLGKRRAPKGECDLVVHDLIEHHEGLLAVVVPPPDLDQDFIDLLCGLERVFDDDRLSIASSCLYGPDDRERLRQLAALSEHVGVPLVATNDAHYPTPGRRPLQDVLTCVRLGCTVAEAGLRLFPHAERSLKPPREMARLFADCPRAIARTVEIAKRAAFSLDELRYQYPEETCPPGRSPMQHLVELTRRGMQERYPHGVPDKVRDQIEHELRLIDELDYARYFLTVHDLVVFARGRGILCQGRGAAANSAVCYCLGVTAVDPDRIDLLFERFVSRERNEPPDIDIDFEHERREEVIQYIYRKYGRDRAALTAEVITYRGRSAVREVGKALGLSLDCVDRLAKSLDWWDPGDLNPARLRELGLNPGDPTVLNLLGLVGALLGFPRHLSQHVGGFVITKDPLCELVPVENAAMADRTVIEWDKDDIDAMGMLKVDVLGLGMLTCVRKAFGLINAGAQGRRGAGAQEERDEQASDDDGENVSGSDCLAERYEACTQGLSGESQRASPRAIRAEDADAALCGVDPVEHCRGIRSLEQGRLPEASTDCPGITGRVDDSARAGVGSGNDCVRSAPKRFDVRGGSHPSGSGSRDPGQDRREDVERVTPAPLRPCAPAPLSLHAIPPEDPTVYDMICAADTIGVFQIESRAQMSMLPRLRPRCFYDLVIEIAIVRPGPIQGDMVHPYLRRRNGEEPVTYPDDAVKRVLGKTLGVPLFQEQAMKLAIVAAGFTPDEADELRRAMAAWKRKGDQIERFGRRLLEGMVSRGYPRGFAQRCFDQIKGFSEYGFPESHAASFALLVYVSAWLKKYHPAAFAAALINSQPMGFYAPAQIVRDAQAHGVEVRGVDVSFSGWDCCLEEGAQGCRGAGAQEGCKQDAGVGNPQFLRLGMRLVKGLREDEAAAVVEAVRRAGPFRSIPGLWRASGVRVSTLRHLAAADAFGSMGLDRQSAWWEIRALSDEELPLFEKEGAQGRRGAGAQGGWKQDAGADNPQSASPSVSQSLLPPIPEPRKVVEDYAAVGLSLKAHPVSFMRPMLEKRGAVPAARIGACPPGSELAVGGLVLVRQRPGTASGIVFMTLEDETGTANLIVRPHIYERHRAAARHGVVVLARGRLERQGEVVHILVDSIENADWALAELTARSRDFH